MVEKKLQGIGPPRRTQGADYRGRFGMGRAAAIAYAREGADVAITYFPSEQSDAQEVITLVKAEGRVGITLPATSVTKVLHELVADTVKEVSVVLTSSCNRAGAATKPEHLSSTFPVKNSTGRLRPTSVRRSGSSRRRWRRAGGSFGSAASACLPFRVCGPRSADVRPLFKDQRPAHIS